MQQLKFWGQKHSEVLFISYVAFMSYGMDIEIEKIPMLTTSSKRLQDYRVGCVRITIYPKHKIWVYLH